MTGILLVDKPENVTSAGVIRLLQPRLGRVRVGHLGTLDPFASGLLPLCLGEATKAARWLLQERKAYAGVLRLGAETDTLDRTGRVTRTAPLPPLEPDGLAAVEARFRGVLRQVPPMYSAIKRDGVPLYRLARRGIEVERQPREITIFHLELRPRDPERLEFTILCSKGTYIRSVATDIGRALGSAAHVETLRRTRVGPFRVEDAHAPAALLASAPGTPLPLIGLREALAGLPAFVFAPTDATRLAQGQQAPLGTLPAPATAAEAALACDVGGRVLGILEAAPDGRWRIARLFSTVER